MGRIILYAAKDRLTTDESGTATLSVKIPGTFSGIDGFTPLQDGVTLPDGRYLRKVQLWSENGSSGDFLNNLRIEDTDGAVAVMAAAFPNYPVIQTMIDAEVSGTATPGIGIPQNQVVTIEGIDPHQTSGLQFFPAGLYLKGQFNAGDGAAGRILNINYIWGKYVNP